MTAPDRSVEQLRAAASAAQQHLMVNWHLPPDMLPDLDSWAPLHALREMRSRPELAHDCILTILQALTDSPDREVGWLDPPEHWWDTPLGQEIRAATPLDEPLPTGWNTAADAAAILDVTRDTIVRWANTGRFPGARRQHGVAGHTGWRWMIPTAAIEAYHSAQGRA